MCSETDNDLECVDLKADSTKVLIEMSINTESVKKLDPVNLFINCWHYGDWR
jgi:hypothetical protein